MPKKTKKPTAPHILISSELGLEAAINSYVDAALALLRKKSKQAKALAKLVAEHDEENRDLETQVLSLETGIQLFCTTHRSVVLPDETKSKSREFGNATVGFRFNPFAVSKLLSNDTWDAIVERLEAAAWGEDFVKTVTTVDKDALLKKRAELAESQLKEVGIAFTQGETFFLEPKSELLEAARNPVEPEAPAAVSAA